MTDTNSLAVRSPLANGHVSDHDLEFSKNLDWKRADELDERLPATNAAGEPGDPRSLTSDISISDITKSPPEALSLISRLLTRRPTTASESAPAPKTNIAVKHTWEGVVTSIGSDIFQAKIVPLGEVEPVLRGEFLIEEVSEDDRELLRVGALFYVVAGRFQVSRHHSQATSTIRFRRMPRIRPEDIEAAMARAREALAAERSE
jgi:hypothetical protein